MLFWHWPDRPGVEDMLLVSPREQKPGDGVVLLWIHIWTVQGDCVAAVVVLLDVVQHQPMAVQVCASMLAVLDTN